MSKQTDQVADALKPAIETEMRKLRDDKKGSTSSAALLALEKLAEEYESGTLIIERQNDAGKYEQFAIIPDYRIGDVLARTPQAIAREEGGAGTYVVKMVTPSKVDGKAPREDKVGPFIIGGTMRREIPRSEESRLSSDPNYNWMKHAMGAMSGALPSQIAAPAKDPPYVRDLLKYIGDSNAKATEQAQSQNKNFMELMGMMLMRQMLPDMQQGGKGNGSDPAIAQQISALQRQVEESNRKLEEERNRREQDERMRLQEERIREIQAQTEQRHRELLSKLEGNQTNQALEMMKINQQSASGKDDTFYKMITLSREESREGQRRFDELLKSFLNQPQENPLAAFQDLMQANLKNNMDMLNTITQLAASGLTGGDSKPSWIDLARDVVGTAREGIANLGNLGRLAGQQEEEYEEEDEAPMPIHAGPTQVQQLPEQGASSAPKEQEVLDPEQLATLLATDKELESMAKDGGYRQIFRALENGKYNEASARIFGLANAGRDVCVRWFSAPGPMSSQILTHFGLSKYMIALAQNMIEYAEFIDGGGNPNDWSDAYQPIKQPKKGEAVKPNGPTTEFGVQQGERVEGDTVDSSAVPPGVDETIAQRQRAIRDCQSNIDRMVAVKENIELVQAGKMKSDRAEFLRGENLLCPAGQEKEALGQVDEVIDALKQQLEELQAETEETNDGE